MIAKTTPFSSLKNTWHDEDIAEASNVLQLARLEAPDERKSDEEWTGLTVLPLFSPDEPPTC